MNLISTTEKLGGALKSSNAFFRSSFCSAKHLWEEIVEEVYVINVRKFALDGDRNDGMT